jgi:hypothetical protein
MRCVGARKFASYDFVAERLMDTRSLQSSTGCHTDHEFASYTSYRLTNRINLAPRGTIIKFCKVYVLIKFDVGSGLRSLPGQDNIFSQQDEEKHARQRAQIAEGVRN